MEVLYITELEGDPEILSFDSMQLFDLGKPPGPAGSSISVLGLWINGPCLHSFEPLGLRFCVMCVRYDVVCCGEVRCGEVWCGEVRCGMVRWGT